MDGPRSFRRVSESLRAWAHRYVIALGVALVLMVGGVVSANAVIDAKISQIPRVDVKTAALPGPAQAGNFLVIGSDTRAFVANDAQAQAFGSKAKETGQRSDTMMVVHVEPGQRRSLIVSIPRDLYVNVPGIGRTKINAAFNDGPQKVIDTLNENFGIQIHHYVEVNFETFQGIVNAIGRVRVYFPYPVRDSYTGLGTELPGCIGLDGDTALKYVRARYIEEKIDGKWQSLSGSDLDRIQRQQDFIRRLGSVAFRRAVSNPFTANEIADAVVPKLKIDAKLGRSEIFSLVNTFRSVDPSDPSQVEMTTFPNKPRGDNANVLPKEPEASQMVARLNQFQAPPGGGVVAPAQVKVRVLNGSGVNGLAKATLDALRQQFGFAPVDAGNWSGKVTTTELRFAPANQSKAEVVQSYLGGTGKLVTDPAVRGADVVVVLGTDFKAVVAAPGAAPAAPAPAGSAAGGGKGGATKPRGNPVTDPASACTP